MANITVSSDVDTMLQSADNAAIRSNIGALGSSSPVNISGNAVVSETLQVGNVATSGTGNIIASGQIIASTQVTAPDRLVTREIKNVNTSSSGQLPINYKSNEHNFQDFDGNPDDLMVIKMIPGEGGRVGINKSDPKCALHVIQEGSDGYPSNEAIRCTGGLRISNWLRLGQYTDSERDAIGLDPPPGLMIYNEEHYEVQVFIANPSGSGRGSWKAFTLQDVSS